MKLKEKQIITEKRKRWQVYTSLDYLLSFITYFDFFSYDTFKIAEQSKYLGQLSSSEFITSDLLIIPFLNSTFEISKTLENYNITKKNVGDIISKSLKIEKKKWNRSFFFYKEPITFDNSIKYSFEVHSLFEKAMENALTRFKTPVITPEILFITLMESKNTKAGKLIKKIISNDTEWYLLRYKLLKNLHHHELSIRNDVKKNEQYFAYLLKTQLSEFEFNRLLQNDLLTFGISFFRNKLISKILPLNMLDILYNDIYTSIKNTSRRTYSN